VSPLRLTILAALLAALLAGCGGSGDDDSGAQSVVASFYPLAFAAEQVGGADVHVTNLTPAGAEPHDIELTARDVARIRDADVVLYLGSGFQPAVEDAVRDAGGKAVDLLEGIRLREPPNEETRADPHVWLDPILYSQVVMRIGDVLGHPQRAGQLESGLSLLDSQFERGLASCRRREIVTSHEAFGYLAARYDLKQVPIAGVSPEAEPTPRALEAAVERVRETGATTVFFETLVSPRIAKTVARETGAKTAVLDPLEGLTDDEVANGDDYFSVMRRNLAALRDALQCR
jgi:zinc transport system substrate-binding protein